MEDNKNLEALTLEQEEDTRVLLDSYKTVSEDKKPIARALFSAFLSGMDAAELLQTKKA